MAAKTSLLDKLNNSMAPRSYVVIGQLVDIELPTDKFDDGNWRSATAIVVTHDGVQVRWLWPVQDVAGEPKLWRLLGDAELAKLAGGQQARFARERNADGKWHTSITLVES